MDVKSLRAKTCLHRDDAPPKGEGGKSPEGAIDPHPGGLCSRNATAILGISENINKVVFLGRVTKSNIGEFKIDPISSLKDSFLFGTDTAKAQND